MCAGYTDAAVARRYEHAADEIERLRQELWTLQTWRNADIDTFHRQKDEINRLQALIDALAAVPHLEVGTDDWWQAIDALLAAATPQEDDR